MYYKTSSLIPKPLPSLLSLGVWLSLTILQATEAEMRLAVIKLLYVAKISEQVHITFLCIHLH